MHVCERILEQEGIHGNVSIDEFQLDLIPLDVDLLSLELPEFYRTSFLVRHQQNLILLFTNPDKELNRSKHVDCNLLIRH